MSSKSQTSQRISSRVLLTRLASDIVEASLDGRQPAELQLDDLLAGFPWLGKLRTAASAGDRDYRVSARPTYRPA